VSFAEKVSGPMIRGIDWLEDELAVKNQTVQPTAESPVRFEIMRETAKRGRGGPPAQMMPIMVPTVLGIRKSLKSLKDNPTQPNRQIDPKLLEELEAYVLRLGASTVGYTKTPGRWVFQNKAILYQNAIVLSMEMDKDLCFPYFSDYYGCSVCIRVCPFNNIAYDKLKVQFLKAKERIAVHGD
jgi:hypothetical protein